MAIKRQNKNKDSQSPISGDTKKSSSKIQNNPIKEFQWH